MSISVLEYYQWEKSSLIEVAKQMRKLIIFVPQSRTERNEPFFGILRFTYYKKWTSIAYIFVYRIKKGNRHTTQYIFGIEYFTRWYATTLTLLNNCLVTERIEWKCSIHVLNGHWISILTSTVKTGFHDSIYLSREQKIFKYNYFIPYK